MDLEDVLTFYDKGGSQVGVGKGTVPDGNGEFTVTITDKKVVVKDTYTIKVSGVDKGEFRCVRGAEAGKKGHTEAKFRRVQKDLALAPDYLATVAGLHSSLKAAEKAVTIEIDQGDLELLRRSGYRLCFAKKVADDDYNIVWQSYDIYLMTNCLLWTPQYQLFASDAFQPGAEVRPATNRLSIGLGETSVLNEVGILELPIVSGPDAAISMDNEYGWIHPGLSQLCTGIDGSQVSTPMYVLPVPVTLGTTSLTPVDKVLVWFERKVKTGMMFNSPRSNSIEIDLTAVNEVTRLYKDGKWSNPGQ